AQGGTAVGAGIEPHRLYWRTGDQWRSLYPWLLFDEETERLFCFHGPGRRPEYLDYGSGEIRRDEALFEMAPTLEVDLEQLSTAPLEEPEPEPAPEGDHFAEFRIVGKLGEGGMGEVYLAEQAALGRRVALKLLPKHLAQDPVALARFRREITALSRCEHPNVVKILTSGTRDGVPFYAMEYVEGADLEHVAKALSKTGDVSAAISTACEATRQERPSLFENVPEVPKPKVSSKTGGDRYLEVARIFRDAALGVEHLHGHGILHRDLKPANVMITAIDHRAVVMDLGLAAMENASVSLTVDKGQVLGTLRYMPPEQLQRSLLTLNRRADVYSLGATLYELITDRPFFDGDNYARLVEQVLREQPVPVETASPGAPTDLAMIVRKATEKDPQLRYDRAAELADDLDAFLENRPISARPPSLGYVFKMAVRRHKALSTVIAASLLIIVAGTIVAFRQITAARDDAELAETAAKKSEADAKENAEEAQRNAEEAQRNLDELLQLSSIEILTDLRRRADEDLWPPVSETIPKMEAWIAEAQQEVLPLLAPLEDQLARIEGEALPYTKEQAQRDRETHPQAATLTEARAKAQELEQQLAEREKKPTGAAALLSGGSSTAVKEEIERLEDELEAQQAEVAGLETLVSERRTFEFEGGEKMAAGEKRWRHRLLRSLLEELQAFVQGPGEADEAVAGYPGAAFGTSLPELRRRLDLARRLHQRTVLEEEAERLWAEAIADIREHPVYGFELAVQEGLIPIGQDPDSTLWEFAVLSTGELPERDAGGHIVVSDTMAVILVLIPGGEFDMGAIRPTVDRPVGSPNVDPQARPDESPIRTVALDSFFLSKYEMTQGQWERTRAARPSYYDVKHWARAAWRRHPVEQVSWTGCEELLPRLGLVLPTEAQWEYGTRAATTSVWWPGNEEKDLQGKASIADLSNHRAGGTQSPVPWDDGFVVHGPIGRFEANRFGLHDVHGNVWEWCRDGLGHYEIDPRPGDGLRQEEGAREHVSRGGSFNSTAEDARSALRNYDTPDLRHSGLGVRPARVITE
ncbi:MAG: SUMF1/EgtB/PvdO family nonheme iron enzyme, partial [Planctomycetota bacterium]